MDNIKTVKRSDLIDLASQMVERYKPDAINEYKCPICAYEAGLFKFDRCELCFNKIEKVKIIDIGYGCVDMLTFEYSQVRLLYWKQVLEYLKSLTSEDVFLGQLRFKCNEIDKKLI